MPRFFVGETMDPDRNKLRHKLVTQTILWLAATGAILFVSAGTIAWPQAWVYLVLWLTTGLASGLLLERDSPAIIAERLRPPIQKDQKPWDKPVILAIAAGWLLIHIVAGLDNRYGWSQMPGLLEIVGALALLLGAYVFYRVVSENAFASATVKVQTDRQHQVIATGPYALVRHPMYAGAIFYLLGSALLLGSWAAFVIALALIALLSLRAVWEEQMLVAELAGYREYAQRVRYRLIPGLW